MKQIEKEQLVAAAQEAATKAYVPYSNFHVGAALLLEDGRQFSGCNVENASYGLTCCAERVTLFKMVSEGGGKVKAMALISPDHKKPITPCGACRQVMMELAPEALILMADNEGAFQETTMNELLPGSFSF